MAEAKTGSAGILSGIRVLDLTRFLSGPQATLFLAGLGAEVIRIDEPATGDPTANAPPFFGSKGVTFDKATPDALGLAYLKRSRGKKAIALNLKAPEGRDLLLQLVEKADVLVENFRVGVMDRLGLGQELLRERNPSLVHCAITGYGSTGPHRHRKAFDLMVQAATGLMSITGEPDGPPSKTGSPLSDGIAGTFALAGILGALFQRERTGQGQFIDISMADCLVSLIFDEPFDCYAQLGLPYRQGNRIARFSPFNTYQTKDGAVAIGAGTEQDWLALLDLMGRDDLKSCSRFANPSWRLANNREVDQVVAQWTAELTSDEVLRSLDARDIPSSPIREIQDTVTWGHLIARGMFQPVKNPLCPHAQGAVAPGFPIKYDRATTGYPSPAPTAKQHNNEVFADVLGLSDSEIATLAVRGII